MRITRRPTVTDRAAGGIPVATGKSDLLQGTLDLLVLKSLQLEPQHGFGIAQRIQQLSSDVLRIEQGSLYPALYRLEEQGWIDAEWGTSDNNRKAKFYALTRSGRRRLEAEEEAWTRLSGAVNQVLALAGGRS
jgi:PadR family transcriptional regulator PadR